MNILSCVYCVQAVQKWCLLVLSALLSDDMFRHWALPWGTALQPLQAGTVETLDTLEALVVLLAAGISRYVPQKSHQQTCPVQHSCLCGAPVQTQQLYPLNVIRVFCHLSHTAVAAALAGLSCFALLSPCSLASCGSAMHLLFIFLVALPQVQAGLV